GWSHNLGVLTADDRPDHLDLNLIRQTRREAVDIKLIRGNSLRFEEDLLPFLLGKADDLIFDRRTIARPNSFNHARVHRGLMEIRSNDFGCGLSRVCDIARKLTPQTIQD